MAGPYREKVFAVAAKIETTSGTDSVPTLAANAVRVVGVPTVTIDDLEKGDRDDVVWGGLGAIAKAPPAGSFVKVDLVLEVMGAGAAYSATVRPPCDVFLRGGGLSATVTATPGSEKVVYTTLDQGMETFSLYLWTQSDVLVKAIGCVAAPKLDAEMAKRGMLTVSVTGKLAGIASTALTTPTVNQTIPPLFHSSTANIGAWTSTDASEPLVVKKVGLDFGTTVVDRGSAGATDGLIGYLITDRLVSHAMTMERVSMAKFDPDAIAKAATYPDQKCAWQIGTAQYNRLKVATGTWMFGRPARSSANGLLTWDLAGRLLAGSETASSREIQLTFD